MWDAHFNHVHKHSPVIREKTGVLFSFLWLRLRIINISLWALSIYFLSSFVSVNIPVISDSHGGWQSGVKCSVQRKWSVRKTECERGAGRAKLWHVKRGKNHIDSTINMVDRKMVWLDGWCKLVFWNQKWFYLDERVVLGRICFATSMLTASSCWNSEQPYS